MVIEMISQEERNRRIANAIMASYDEYEPKETTRLYNRASNTKMLSDLEFGDKIIFEWGDDEIYVALKVTDTHGFVVKGEVLMSDRADYRVGSMATINFGYDKNFRLLEK